MTSTSRPRLRPVVFAVLILGSSTAASAQDRGSVYAIGGVVVASQDGPSGESSETYVTAPGGTTLGWLAGAGVFVASAVALEVEISSTGWMTAREPSRYGMTFNEERRDRFFTFAARLPLPRTGSVRVEPVVGVVVTKPEAWSQTERYRFWLSPEQVLEVDPRRRHELGNGIGLAFGIDVRLGGPRLALLPSFRVLQSGVSGGRYDDSSEPRDIGSVFPGGYPKWTVRSGVALRIDL